MNLADSMHRDNTDPVGVSVQQLMSHAYLVGPSGTGKTTLLTSLVLSLAASGTAGVVLDPHGQGRLPLHRKPRCFGAGTAVERGDPGAGTRSTSGAGQLDQRRAPAPARGAVPAGVATARGGRPSRATPFRHGTVPPSGS